MNKKQYPKFAVVTGNRNRFEITSRCIKALDKVSYPNLEIVVVDDGSTDNSVDRFKTEHPEIKLVVNKKNIGYAKGHNKAIKVAIDNGAEYVLIINNDTKDFSKNFFKEMVKAFRSSKKIGAVGSLVEDFDGKEVRVGGKIVNKLGVYSPLAGEGFAVSKKALETVGFFDESLHMYFDEIDFTKRLEKAGFKAIPLNKVKFSHESGVTVSGLQLMRNYYRLRNVFVIVKRYSMDKSFSWKKKQFLNALYPHWNIFKICIKKGDFRGALGTFFGTGFALINGMLIYLGVRRLKPYYGIPLNN